MNLSRVQREMQEDSFWRLSPVQGLDMVLTNRYGANDTLSLLYCDLYLRQFKETLKQTMLEQESVFEDQIRELHRLYQRQKELMLEMEGTINLYSQPQHLFLDAGASSPRVSIHWMSSSISTSKISVLPPQDASAKIDEAEFSGYKSDKASEKVLDIELPSYGYLDLGEEGSKNGEVHEVSSFPKDHSLRNMSLESVFQPENLQHLTGLPKSKSILDLNEPAKIEDYLDYELNQLLSPAQRRSERAEPEAQDRPISTKRQAEGGIDLNVSLLSSEEEVTITKTIESEQAREFVSASLHGKQGSEPSRAIVQALPCLKSISLFHKRSSRPRKKEKCGAKSTTVNTRPRRKVGSNEDDNHSLSASCIPESVHYRDNMEKGCLSSLPEAKPAGNRTNPGKRRRCKPQIESGKVMRKIARSKPKSRGRFVVTEEEEQEKSAAAKAIVDMSLSESSEKSSIETCDCIAPLHWFAKIAASVFEDSKSEVGLSVTGFHSDYHVGNFEAMAKEQRTHTSVSNAVHPKRTRTSRSQGKRQQQHREILPSLGSFAGNEASQDVNKIERLLEASERNDTHSSCYSLIENMVIDWGTVRKRRRGIRTPAANTKKKLP